MDALSSRDVVANITLAHSQLPFPYRPPPDTWKKPMDSRYRYYEAMEPQLVAKSIPASELTTQAI